MKKICVVTGTRAEYGLLKPVMEAVRASRKLKLQVLATGMHLSEEFGHSVDEIEKDGFRIDSRVPMLQPGDDKAAMAEALGVGVQGMTRAFKELAPDVAMVLGDRVEAFAAASTGALMGLAVAHIHGGDRARGGFDDYMRHAITKMAHIHFAATPESYQRVLKLGEDPAHVHCVGAPGMDTILHGKATPKKSLLKKLDLKGEGPILVAVQHPVSTRSEEAKSQIRETIKAIKRLKLETAVIYPNSDAGGRAIIAELKKLEGFGGVKIYKNLAREDYLGLLRCASVLIGNSSSGIIESTPLGLPAINIGDRQQGRERGENVVDCPYDASEIARMVRFALENKEFKAKVKAAKSPYGDGTAGKKIAEILEKTRLNKALLLKQITY